MQKLNFMLEERPLWKNWKKESECSEQEKQQANLRSLYDDELVLDLDKPENYQELSDKLEAAGLSFDDWKTGSKGNHFHLRFAELANLGEKQREYIREQIITFFGCDTQKKSGLIAREDKIHFKTGRLKTKIKTIDNGENTFAKIEAAGCKLDFSQSKQPKRRGIIELALAAGLEIKKVGDTYQTLCIFHQEIDPSLSLYPNDNHFHCYGCGKHGNLEDFKQAVDWMIKEKILVDRLKITWAKDLSNISIKPVGWIVENLIADLSISYLAGKRAGFKSFTAIHIALCVATGRKVFGLFEVKKIGKVLIIDEENGLPIIKQRIDSFKKKMPNVKDDDITLGIISFSGLKLDDEDWAAALTKIIEKEKPILIIIDSFRRFVKMDENDAGKISSLFTDTIRQISEKYNVAWIFLHHLRKGISGRNPIDELDELRGSSDMVNYADIVLIQQRSKASSSFIFKQLKNRYMQEIEAKVIELRWNDDSLEMVCVGDVQQAIQADVDCGNRILEWMFSSSTSAFKKGEVTLALTNVSPATLKRGLRYLLDTGKLISSKRGFYELNPLNKDFGSKAQKAQEPKLSELKTNENEGSEGSDIYSLSQKSQNNYKKLKFLHGVPRFVGEDMQPYGAFEAGEEASIPELSANLLINRERAVELK